MENKISLMKQLIQDLRNEKSVSDIKAIRNGQFKNLGLINQFSLHDVIPNKWFDWERRATSKIMLIGQDWGPYVILEKYIKDYQSLKDKGGFDYDKFLFSTFSSRTEKFILKTIEETYRENHGTFYSKVFDDFLFTMAVLFTRQGEKFRGNENFDEKKSFEASFPYVSRQLEIVKPRIIITLGNLALRVVDTKYGLGLNNKNLSQVISSIEKSDGIIKSDNIIIIPNYHPASHINPKIQKEIWRKLWSYY